MLYGWKCKNCGAKTDSPQRIVPPTCDCSWLMVRDYSSIQLAPVMQEHYNPSVNGLISSERQLNDHWKRKSDEASEQTGIEHRFVPADPKDLHPK